MSVIVADAFPEGSSRQTAAAGGAGPYQALYRRYRPQCFGEVRGQPLVAETLRNAIREGKIVHAYLFSGPRGTGKTSMARILAKALNCSSLEDGEPCGRCVSCLDIAQGLSLDVHELDAASNNGVEAMRDLVARASLSSPGRHKVYIVDEVHMLSTAASNALLKTLEEPPEHVVFVLATTDPQKVLPTIRSRTQHFEFHLLDADVLERLLADVAADANLELPPDGIEWAVRRGRGSARDALSVLDQVVVSGVARDDDRFLAALIGAIAEQDPRAALEAVGAAVSAGLDAHRLGGALVETLREQFLASVARRAVRPEADVLAADGRPLLSPARSVRALELVGKALVDMRDAVDPRTTLEVAIVRLSSPEVDDSTAALVDRFERLEARVAELERAGAGSPGSARGGMDEPSVITPPAEAGVPGAAKPALGAYSAEARGRRAESVPPPLPPAEPAKPVTQPSPASPLPLPTRDDVVTAWADSILPSLKPRAKALYAIGRWTAVEGIEAVFALPNAAHVDHAEVLRDDVATALSSHFGMRMTLRLVVDSEQHAETTSGEAEPPGDEAPHGSEGRRDAADGPSDTVTWAESRVREAFPGVEEVRG